MFIFPKSALGLGGGDWVLGLIQGEEPFQELGIREEKLEENVLFKRFWSLIIRNGETHFLTHPSEGWEYMKADFDSIIKIF